MNDVTTTQIAAGVRQIVLILGGFAIGKGWLGADTVEMLGAVALVVVPLVWGQISTRKLAQK
ncbi:MAG: hypothetical protein H2050_15870 [Sphingobium sp.]|uniref:Pam3-gp28 family putative phage holin n=1 Tax=Sphingobium sp. TaxID=1912891 RepID=UPI0017F4A1F0|nr:hypothetical protein [Sphingobium sp.]MBA4756304.1 hypothetical protein [Sphingobium sp.]